MPWEKGRHCARELEVELDIGGKGVKVNGS